jgi:hypothetical protein
MDMGIAEANQTGALRVLGDAALDSDRAHLVGAAFRRAKRFLFCWFHGVS